MPGGYFGDDRRSSCASIRRTPGLFRGHHYLSAELSKQARCFVATWNDAPVAFTSYLHQPGINKRQKREHRTVVLPDYQGVGIGNALSAWLGAYLTAQGWRFTSATSHPAMIRHRLRDPRWRLIRAPGHGNRNYYVDKDGSRKKRGGSTGRVTASFEWVGLSQTAKAASRPGPVDRSSPDPASAAG